MDKIHPEANLSAFDLLRESNLLTSREIEITESWDATALLGLLASAKISSLEVTAAFCKRATIAQQLVS
jgi:amidase